MISIQKWALGFVFVGIFFDMFSTMFHKGISEDSLARFSSLLVPFWLFRVPFEFNFGIERLFPAPESVESTCRLLQTSPVDLFLPSLGLKRDT